MRGGIGYHLDDLSHGCVCGVCGGMLVWWCYVGIESDGGESVVGSLCCALWVFWVSCDVLLCCFELMSKVNNDDGWTAPRGGGVGFQA
jgi:hypothetical protein